MRSRTATAVAIADVASTSHPIGRPSRIAAQRRGRPGEVASLVERRVAAQIRGPITARGNWAQDGARKFIARQTAPPRARSRSRNAEWEMGR